MDAALDRIWNSLPAVQALEEPAEKVRAAVDAAEAQRLLELIHRASFANSDATDNSAAATAAMAAPAAKPTELIIPVPTSPEPADSTEAAAPQPEKGPVGFNRTWLAAVITDFVLVEWINVAQFIPGRPTTPGGDAPTPISLAIEAIADAIVDDRAPNALLDAAEVLLVPGPKAIPVNFSSYVTLQDYPTHDAVYDAMWDSLEKNADGVIDQLQFIRFFTCLYSYLYTNATPKRCESAAKKEWYDAVKVTGVCDAATFRAACDTIALIYARRTDSVAFYVDFMAKASSESPSSPFDAKLSPEEENLLVDPTALYAIDGLDAPSTEIAFWQTATQNRVLVSGKQGMGQSVFGAALAKRLNAVHLDVFELASAATVEGSMHPLAATLRANVEENKPVTRDTQAALIRQKLDEPATGHRGYVLSDIPIVEDNDAGRSAAAKFGDALGLEGASLPQAVVTLEVPESVYGEMRQAAVDAGEEAYKVELQLRENERAEQERIAAELAAKEAQKKRKEELTEQKAKIDAGEVEATEEEVAAIENELEQMPEDEEEPEPEVDEDGVPLEPEVIEARKVAAAKAVERRRFLADLRRLILEDRALDSNAVQAVPSATASFATTVEVSQARGRVLALPAFDAAAKQVEFAVERLALVPTAIPSEPPLPEDALEGIEAGPEGDIALGEAKIQHMTETLGFQFSKWQRFCPVTWMNRRVLVEGSTAFAVVYRGFIFAFVSPEARDAFVASPHPYLLEPVVKTSPVLCMYRHGEVLSEADRVAVEAKLAEQLALTPVSLASFNGQWQQHKDEVARRASLVSSRVEGDEAKKKVRDERIRKRLEAEAKKRKKEEKAKKTKKKAAVAEEEVAAVAETPDPDAAAEEPTEPPVETTAEKLEKVVDAAVALKSTFFPQFVSCTDVSEEQIVALFDHRVLPPVVVCFDSIPPPPKDEDGNDIIDEEEEEQDEEPEMEEVVGEDGEVTMVPKPPKPFDPADVKMCKTMTAKLVARLTVSGTEEDTDGPQPPDPEDAAAVAAYKAPQQFRVSTINVFGKGVDEIVAIAVQALCPVAELATLPQDGEELVVDPEPEDDDEEEVVKPHPLVVPGKKAVHQYGDTLRFCPVTLRNDQLLVEGDPNFWLTFRGQRFTFASQEALDAFKLNPLSFVSDRPRDLPPPRLWILGVQSSGKRTLAAALTKEFGIPSFQYDVDFWKALIAAASLEEGGEVDGLQIPCSRDNAYLQRAIDIQAALDAFDLDQQEKADLKKETEDEQAAREEARDNDESVSELGEEEEEAIARILEFEPEEEEMREERIGKAHRQMCAALTRIEPFENAGYMMLSHPANELEFEQLVAEGCVPEAVVHVKLSVEHFVMRRVDDEVHRLKEAYQSEVDSIQQKKKAQQIAMRNHELNRWRRRNIGADDEVEEPQEEEFDDPEPVNVENVKSELEGQHDTELTNVQSVLGLLPDKRIQLVEVNGDAGPETVVSTSVDFLGPIIARRRSLLEAPLVVTYDEAIEMLEDGRKLFSSCRFTDPVKLFDERNGAVPTLKAKVAGRTIEMEPLEPEPEPEPEPVKRRKIVMRENEDGEEVEVETDEEEPEPEPEEPEEEEELEPEPELSEEELEEMQQEHVTAVKAAIAAKRPRAAVLRNRVYFFESNATLLRFMQAPLSFWDLPPPPPPVSTVVAMYENLPEATEAERPRGLAHQVAYNAGFEFIDVPKLMKWALHCTAVPSLSNGARQLLLTGDAVPSEFLSAALLCRLQALDVKNSGAVLVNLPRTPITLDALVNEGLAINKVLQVRDSERMTEQINAVATVAHKVVNGAQTSAALVECLREIKSSVSQRQRLQVSRQLAFPAPLYDTSVTEKWIRENLSAFSWYCPCLWTRDSQLVDMRNDHRYSAEFLGSVFAFSAQSALDEFLVYPHLYSGELNEVQTLPEVLPRRLTAAEKPSRELELFGCCPVTLYKTRHNVGLKGVTEPTAVKGSPEIVAEYNGKFYTVVDEESMELFLRQPWVFADGAVLPLPHKLPFERDALKDVSDDKYITLTLKENIARAMLAAARTRPKFPGLSVEESALKFVALHLKANNSLNTEFRSNCYTQSYENFKERATLYETITTEAPEDPAERDAFEHRCQVWDEVQDDLSCYQEYNKLKPSE